MSKGKHFLQFQWHPVGQRILKTSIAVTLCLFFYMLRGYRGEGMPSEAAITAIICMQPYMHSTTENALSRLTGTLIGAVWGFLFLLAMLFFPAIGSRLVVLYLLMGLGTLLSLHTAVLLGKPDASGLAGIVFLCVVIAYPDIPNPMDQAFHRILDVMVGTVIALGVNAFRLPRVKQKNKIFFMRTSDLAMDQFSSLPSGVLFKMQHLMREGARVCLMSEHAPSFHASQLGQIHFTLPMIVMDGAAIFDANENSYIAATHPDPTACRWLVKRLETMGESFFVYTIHRDRNCIYHHGPMTQMEQTVYRHLKKSPYRYYLDDDHYAVGDVVYLKIVADKEHIRHVKNEIAPSLEKMKLRCVIRPQAGLEDGCSLYFYALHADMAHAKDHLMRLLRQNEPALKSCDILSDTPYRSEHDASRLIRKLHKEYEPIGLSPRQRKA